MIYKMKIDVEIDYYVDQYDPETNYGKDEIVIENFTVLGRTFNEVDFPLFDIDELKDALEQHLKIAYVREQALKEDLKNVKRDMQKLWGTL